MRDGVLERSDRADGSSTQRRALHQARVELQRACGRQATAGAGVEHRIVFEQGDGSLHRVEGAAARREDIARAGRGGSTAFDVTIDASRGHVTRAAVDQHAEASRQDCPTTR